MKRNFNTSPVGQRFRFTGLDDETKKILYKSESNGEGIYAFVGQNDYGKTCFFSFFTDVAGKPFLMKWLRGYNGIR